LPDREIEVVSRFSKLFGRDKDDSENGIECADIRELSSDYIDEEMDPENREQVRAHLEWCKLCLAFVNTLKATVGLLSSSEPPQPPPALKEHIRTRLRS
jgi:predicted anti-sigma-YlaC factor YlaD